LIFYLNFLLQLSNGGGRIIIASDGVWDDLSFEMALECSRGYPSDIAANRIVNVTILLHFHWLMTQTSAPLFHDILSSYLKEAILPRGLRDDILTSNSGDLLYLIRSLQSASLILSSRLRISSSPVNPG
jgi:hypothetical protein